MKNTIFLFLLIALNISCGKEDEPSLRTTGSMLVTVLNNSVIVADAEVSTIPPTKIVHTDQTGTALISDIGIGKYKVEAFRQQLAEGFEFVTVVENEVADVTIKFNYNMFDRPVVRLQLPSDSSSHDFGNSIRFAAYVSDVKDLPNTLDITWSSNIDGIFNEDAADLNGNILFHFDNLSKGEHLISLKAIDSEGFEFTDNVTITVQ